MQAHLKPSFANKLPVNNVSEGLESGIVAAAVQELKTTNVKVDLETVEL
jgi:hypothetical protein